MMLRTPLVGKRPRWEIEETQAATPVASGSAQLVRFNRFEELGCGDGDDDFDLGGDAMRCSYKCRNMVKSELIDRLELQETELADYNSACEALSSKLGAADIENQRLAGKLKHMEQTVAAATAQEQSIRSQRYEEIEKGEERFRKQLSRCNELQDKLQAELRSRSEAEAKARAAEAEAESLRQDMKTLQDNSSREIRRLEFNVKRMQEENEYTKLNVENVAERHETDNVSMELSYLREQHKELQDRLDVVMNEKQQLERELTNASSQLSTTRITDTKEAETIIKNLREELNHQSSEIAEARRLKESHQRLEILQEQLESERRRASRAEAELEDLADLKLRLSSLEAEHKAWEEMLAALPGNLSRETLTEKLRELQRDTLVTMSENGELQSKIKELQSSLENALTERNEALRAAGLARQEAEEAQGKAYRFERQIGSLTRERDGLKSLLASYDEEEALLHQHKSGSTPVSFETPEKSKQKRIQELEDVLDSLRGNIKSLEDELEKSLEETTTLKKHSEALASELSSAQSKVSALEQQNSELQDEILMFEKKVARGEFDPSKTKVLRLRADSQATEIPCSSSTTICDTLESDTQEKISFMIENKRKIATLTDKIGSLEQEISTLRKRENRYMQVFAEKAFTFRHACGLIFGYEILMNEKPDSAVTSFKLKSVYSRDKENEALEFQYTPSGPSTGRIDMLANDYTTSPEIERQVVTFLQGFKSIPAFVANITLEQFNKGTIG